MQNQILSEQEWTLLDKWWRASNYLAAGQNFIYTHLNRLICKYDVNMIYLSGPGHGGNAMVAQSWMDGSYSEVYPNVGQDKEGLKKLFKQFSFPGGISSHVAPEVPGSIHEGGELGYSLAHAFGAVFDNPDLIAACVVGDGEAETGPLATAWQSNKFINPDKDGAVLPILHLNGYKIANPTILARTPDDMLRQFFAGMGWKPYFVEGSDPGYMHQAMAEALELAYQDIRAIQETVRAGKRSAYYVWPMIILRAPKGWTGPKKVDGQKIEDTFRAHQVPISLSKPEHVQMVEDWLRSYKPEELFDRDGRLLPEIAALAPKGDRRMAANPHANGGRLLRDLKLPDFRDYALDVPAPGAVEAQDMLELGAFVRDIVQRNPDTFRIFGPDETMSNRLNKVFEVSKRVWNGQMLEDDEYLAQEGRIVDSMLSEHCCEGWLEGVPAHRAARHF